MHQIIAPLVFALSLFGSDPSALTQRIDRASASIVRITGTKTVETFLGPAERPYVCTGFVIAPARVATAAHCLGTALRVDGVPPVELLATSAFYDLALLRVETTKPILPIRPTAIRRFERVIGLGYGYGWTRLTTTFHRVMLVNHLIDPELPPGLVVQAGYIGGMSGGPVIDAKGYLVGMVQRSNAQIGYGVGLDILRAFLLGL